MAGLKTRNKGKRGEREAKALLAFRDFVVHDLENGQENEDMLATDCNGIVWSVEIKNTMNIMIGHRRQAKKQADKSKKRWLLMNKIHNTSSWLIQRQGELPSVWHGAE